MSSFTNALILRKKDKDKWVVQEDFYYHVGRKDSEEKIKVLKHFMTDLASVPKIFRGLIPKDGTYSQAAVLHDYLYFTKGYFGKYTKKECDKIFLEAMEVLGVSLWKRKVMYRAVRLAFWNDWEKPSKD